MPDYKTVEVIFKGKGSEYFKIWIVNLFLSIITFGIYSAWAKVRTKRYLYGNTSIDGASFEYHASPIAILKGRLIAFALLVIYSVLSDLYPLFSILLIALLTIVIPWIVWRSLKFNARMTSLRNVHFSFKGLLKKSYLYYLIVPFILPLLISLLISFAYSVIFNGFAIERFYFYPVDIFSFEDKYFNELFILFAGSVSIYILIIPYIHKLKIFYYLNNSYFGQGKFSSDILASKFYLIDILTFLVILSVLLFPALILYGSAFYGSAFYNLLDRNDNIGIVVALLVSIIIYLVMLTTVFLSTAFFNAKVRNYVYSKTKLNGDIFINSNLHIWRLFWIYLSNFFLMIFTFGLAYPWTIIRKTTYMAETVSISNAAALSLFLSQQEQKQSALGEEIGEAFDVGSGIDF